MTARPPTWSRRRLTRAELEVLRLLADGSTLVGIAQLTLRSKETLKTHMRAVREKLDARTSTHAVAIALRRGLIRMSRATPARGDG